jgi:hypothetical protein
MIDLRKYHRHKTVCRGDAVVGSYLLAFTMPVAASVIGCRIQSIYPPRNGIHP